MKFDYICMCFIKEKPEYCCIDPENRYTLGCSAGNAQSHGLSVCQVGWALSKTADAAAWEVPPPNEDLGLASLEKVVDANTRFEKLADGLIPPLVAPQIVLLGATHTTVFLRQVKGGVASLHQEIADRSGRLSQDRL